MICIRLLDTLQKLSRIGRQRLDISALPFGVNGVECKGRLARPGDSGHHGKGVVRDFKINVFEIMGTRPADDDLVVFARA